MKSHRQLTESIERYRQSFWNKTMSDRPPVGVSCEGSNTPINYLRRRFEGTELFPQDVSEELCMSDYEYMSPERRVFSDDLMPFNTAWRAVPWLEAMCGCPVRYSEGSLAPGHCTGSLEELVSRELPSNKGWYDCLERQTEMLVSTSPDDCWISPSILRGPSDILAAVRGMANFFCDLHDNITLVDKAAAQANRLLLDILDMHFRHVHPHMGGYVHNYGYWAPGKTYVIQDDAMGMCSPAMYRDVFMSYNAEIVQSLGDYILFHLHSTGIQFYHDLLTVPGLAGIEVTLEENGPRPADLVPMFRKILEQSRLIVFAYHFFEEMAGILDKIPHEGLYLVISDKFIQSEDEFRTFIEEHW